MMGFVSCHYVYRILRFSSVKGKNFNGRLQQSVTEDLPQLKQMEVCEVCGAFLIVGDAPQRQDEHLMGKQHAGYAQVRAEIEKRKVSGVYVCT